MAAFIIDDMNIHHISPLVFIVSIPHVGEISTVPNFLCKFWKTFPKCEEVGAVKGVHLISGEVRRVATALKVVEEVQEV